MANYLVKVHSSDEWFNGDCDYALIDMTPRLAATMLLRILLVRIMKRILRDVYELYFWDYSPCFVSSSETSEDIEFRLTVENDCGKYEEQAFVRLQDSEADGSKWVEPSVEIVQMAVRDDEVVWTASPKHSDVYVTTEALPMSEVIGALTPFWKRLAEFVWVAVCGQKLQEA